MKALKNDLINMSIQCRDPPHNTAASVSDSKKKGPVWTFPLMWKWSWWALTWTGTLSPLVPDTIYPVCPTKGSDRRSPQRECPGRGWQTPRIQWWHCPPGAGPQNHSPIPGRWNLQKPRSAHCSRVCHRGAAPHAGCPLLSEISPRLEKPDWFL